MIFQAMHLAARERAVVNGAGAPARCARHDRAPAAPAEGRVGPPPRNSRAFPAPRRDVLRLARPLALVEREVEVASRVITACAPWAPERRVAGCGVGGSVCARERRHRCRGEVPNRDDPCAAAAAGKAAVVAEAALAAAAAAAAVGGGGAARLAAELGLLEAPPVGDVRRGGWSLFVAGFKIWLNFFSASLFFHVLHDVLVVFFRRVGGGPRHAKLPPPAARAVARNVFRRRGVPPVMVFAVVVLEEIPLTRTPLAVHLTFAPPRHGALRA